jgi:predicted nucleic acid-binding protein
VSEVVLLDSSAVLAWIYREEGFEIMGRMLSRAADEDRRVFMAQISLLELAKSMKQAQPNLYPQSMSVVRMAPIDWLQVTDAEAVAAGELRADYRMSTADAIIVVLARRLGAELWHKDPEFDSLPENFVKVKRLPYKKRRKK